MRPHDNQYHVADEVAYHVRHAIAFEATLGALRDTIERTGNGPKP
jgi:hypothetical protein